MPLTKHGQIGDDGCMADINSFRGFRFNPKIVSLDQVLSPPYDVINEQQSRLLRALPMNTIHLELPLGVGLTRYKKAVALWREWRKKNAVVQEDEAAIYVLEERFQFEGKKFRRLGFLAALDLNPNSMSYVVPHEKTLSAPKADRLKILETVKVNFSPIFAIYADKNKKLRKLFNLVSREKAMSRGVLPTAPKTDCRFWKITDPKRIAEIKAGIKKSQLLIADGHHRLGAACDYFKKNSHKTADKVLAYFCAEDDLGLLVLPTHRILPKKILERAGKLCRLTAFPNRQKLLRALDLQRNPYACGIFENGNYYLAVPRLWDGCVSHLGVEWLRKSLLSHIAPKSLRYSHDAKETEELAKSLQTSAVFVKPFSVSAIRKAALALGLLPPKSTYFYPKVTSGLVFNSLEN